MGYPPMHQIRGTHRFRIFETNQSMVGFCNPLPLVDRRNLDLRVLILEYAKQIACAAPNFVEPRPLQPLIPEKRIISAKETPAGVSAECPSQSSGAESGARGAQFQAQRLAAGIGGDSHKTTQAETDSDFVPIPACCDVTKQNYLVPPRGLEPLSSP
jgi:hypothetical protein